MADPPAPDELQLLTVKQVARRLNVSERTVERLVERGHLSQPRKLGGSRRWFTKDVEWYLYRLLRGDFEADERPTKAKKRQVEAEPDTAAPKPDKPRQAPKRGSSEPPADG